MPIPIKDPRKVDGIYFCGYWGYQYKVLAISGFRITCQLTNNDRVHPDLKKDNGFEIGRVWSHMTAWDPRSDKVL